MHEVAVHNANEQRSEQHQRVRRQYGDRSNAQTPGKNRTGLTEELTDNVHERPSVRESKRRQPTDEDRGERTSQISKRQKKTVQVIVQYVSDAAPLWIAK
ncbi:uncharacterized protein LAESUDRAFT_155587 [Laetiporus sulphureus 93-53]|uniref:Uncharacterized protein n=1 Tax=Laetiporus sulphureus 93-53 TaxID=1314785 RepID=A0A165HKT0_9APHY|nr:uncharacterized protein LAESUDRAFT_155587 [Laetiporus sulphureus 93-53]KZT11859.1 hypothetical protein LAESUDRAFT_155587 [Laetiporus sulphureus 93-53]